MRIRWTPPAAEDLERIKAYLDLHFPHVAQSTVHRIYVEICGLKRFPYRGRAGLRAGTRELILHPLPYIVAYRIREDAIEVLHIEHGAQNRT